MGIKKTNQDCPNCGETMLLIDRNDDLTRLSCVSCISIHYTDEVEHYNKQKTIFYPRVNTNQ